MKNARNDLSISSHRPLVQDSDMIPIYCITVGRLLRILVTGRSLRLSINRFDQIKSIDWSISLIDLFDWSIVQSIWSIDQLIYQSFGGSINRINQSIVHFIKSINQLQGSQLGLNRLVTLWDNCNVSHSSRLLVIMDAPHADKWLTPVMRLGNSAVALQVR